MASTVEALSVASCDRGERDTTNEPGPGWAGVPAGAQDVTITAKPRIQWATRVMNPYRGITLNKCAVAAVSGAGAATIWAVSRGRARDADSPAASSHHLFVKQQSGDARAGAADGS